MPAPKKHLDTKQLEETSNNKMKKKLQEQQQQKKKRLTKWEEKHEEQDEEDDQFHFSDPASPASPFSPILRDQEEDDGEGAEGEQEEEEEYVHDEDAHLKKISHTLPENIHPDHANEKTVGAMFSFNPASGSFKQRARILSMSIAELAAALFVKILFSRFFWFLVLICAVLLGREHEDELRLVMSSATPSGLSVEEADRPGLVFDPVEAGSRIQRPVVFMPGFVTTALELWKSKPCMHSDFTTNFRSRMFGTSALLKLMTDSSCYLEHIALDPDTAWDPSPDIKVRHDTGFDSVDNVGPQQLGFWVWNKLMINLADIGFEPSNLVVASYDWRLSPKRMEERYGFFTRLKQRIELKYKASVTPTRPDLVAKGKKQEVQPVVIVSHSYGALVTAEFLTWCDEQEPGWTNKHVAVYVNVGGAVLGIAKSLAALVSGEIKETALLPSMTRRILDSHVLRRERANAFRSWPCLSEMLPRGPPGTHPGILQWHNGTNLTMRETIALVRRIAESAGHSRLVKDLDEAELTGERWRVPKMPKAPKMKIICVYGVEKQTDVGYYFHPPAMIYDGKKKSGGIKNNSKKKNINSNNSSQEQEEDEEEGASNSNNDNEADEPQDEDHGWHPDIESVTLDHTNPNDLEGNSVRFGNGDGTVPLASLGYACRSQKHGWKKDVGSVITVELPDRSLPAWRDPRGGKDTADHVDIMGNHRAIEIVLEAASGLENQIHNHVVSEIDEIVEELDKNADQMEAERKKKIV